nr:hypothetical protein [Tanacetum cinerariifolium]
VKGLALCLSNVISEDSDSGLNVECAQFPNEVTSASLSMPSSSGSKLLTEHGGNLSEAVNSHFAGDTNIHDTNVAAPHEDFMDIDEPSQVATHIPPFSLLLPARDLHPFSLLEPTGLGLTSAGPFVSHGINLESRHLESVPIIDQTDTLPENVPESAPRFDDFPSIPEGIPSGNSHVTPSAPSISDIPDDGIEEQMIEAAIEASKRKAELGLLDGVVPQNRQSQLDDPQLKHAVSLSLKGVKGTSHLFMALGDVGEKPKSEKLRKPMAQWFSPPSSGANTFKGLALCLSNVISEDSDGGLNVECAPFPIEVTGASLSMPSPSGSMLLAVRNPENDLATHLKILGPFQLEKEIRVPQSMHGSMYYESFKRYYIVNGVVEVDGVKDEAKTGTTDDNAKEGGHQVVADRLLSLKQRSLITDDATKVANNIKQSAKLLQLKTFESATNGIKIVTEALIEEPSLYSAANVYKLLQIKRLMNEGIPMDLYKILGLKGSESDIEFKKAYDKASTSPYEYH